MAKTKYGTLVESARVKRQSKFTKSFESLTFDGLQKVQSNLILWARALDAVNKHITIPQDQVDEAAGAYALIASELVKKLKWDQNDIKILPQGSSSTQTLIKSPDASKFDIDAVCQVNISRIDARNPMRFFNEIGEALETFTPDPKKRCWRIEFPNYRFYIEFTPSVPLSTVPTTILDSVRYKPAIDYRDTALAVVDTPTEQWKTSNPEGIANWLETQAKKNVMLNLALEKATLTFDASISPVPDQEIPLSDTLRVAIRLFKRHRDMSVRRGYLNDDYKPISIIITTLLTQCFEGLADNQVKYDHPIKLLIDLAELLPGMIEVRNREYWVANPTVEGENFAERWNHDQGERKEAFDKWCNLLIDDLQSILSHHDEALISERVREVFGCTAAKPSDPKPSVGLAPKAPSRLYSPPATKGLA
ncbi:MAG: nucleotidyltransferase [Methylococcales bacterium]|nr:nucleotidyltransferase [Methylococcales bacterium]MDD5631019.1 nucleotidyltransferase [Methylococcales bacterium]